jgi:hypothetical protein
MARLQQRRQCTRQRPRRRSQQQWRRRQQRLYSSLVRQGGLPVWRTAEAAVPVETAQPGKHRRQPWPAPCWPHFDRRAMAEGNCAAHLLHSLRHCRFTAERDPRVRQHWARCAPLDGPSSRWCNSVGRGSRVLPPPDRRPPPLIDAAHPCSRTHLCRTRRAAPPQAASPSAPATAARPPPARPRCRAMTTPQSMRSGTCGATAPSLTSTPA